MGRVSPPHVAAISPTMELIAMFNLPNPARDSLAYAVALYLMAGGKITRLRPGRAYRYGKL